MQHIISLFLVILVGLVAADAAGIAGSPNAGGGSDVSALVAFVRGVRQVVPSGQTTPPPWNPSNSVDASGCPANWHGVECYNGRILAIALDGLGLAGAVDFSALAAMPMLQNLTLSNNRLEGLIPREIGSLPSLQLLDLSNNGFSGPIPAELTNLTNLTHLDLSYNGFAGPVPTIFQNLRKLAILDLHENELSGKLDDVLAQLHGPSYVDLSCNQFSGSLKSVSDNSSLTSSVHYLNVSYNALSGTLFASDPVPLFDNLQVFDCSYNKLSGSLPSFNFVVSLEILRLQGNNFSGSIPDALFDESSMVLTELDLSCNQLTGRLGRVKSETLKYLNLSFNSLAGSLPITVGSCSVVDLSHNALSGNVSVIRTWGNYVEIVDLSSNSLTGSIPNDTTQFLRLTSLKASSNQLSGELSPAIGTYPKLSTLDLSNNKLDGPLPVSLFASMSLTYLNLSRNGFAGAMPIPSLPAPALPAQSSNLSVLDVSDNNLSGALPHGIGGFGRLYSLIVAGNNFSGEIPKEIGELKELLYLDLSVNHFDGVLPGDLPNGLIGFNVSGNSFSGTVPANLLRFPDSAFHPGNNLLTFPRSPANSSGFNFNGRMRHAIIYALAGFVVAVVAVMILLAILRRTVLSRRTSGKRVDSGKLAANRVPGGQKGLKDPPCGNQGMPLPSNSPRPSTENGDVIMSVGALTAESMPPTKAVVAPGMPSSVTAKEDGKCSPPTEPCQQHQILNVRSPDKMVGDLIFFDSVSPITADELSRAPAEIVGRSCHGTSYKVSLGDGRMLTVKWLKEGFVKSKKEFLREVRKLGGIRHPSLVALRGYYWGPKEHERILISDYVDAASLHTYLAESDDRSLIPLTLANRLAAAISVARCLEYLHNGRAIPHGNIKSSNILIHHSDHAAFLTDFSLHRLMTPAGTAEQVLNATALGYSPPEFASTTKPCPSVKSDVYAFGVVLLELLTGRAAGEIVCDDTGAGVVDLIDWVRAMAAEGRPEECFDRRMPEAVESVMHGMLRIALRCIRSASERPEIRTVYEDLVSVSD